MSSSDRKHIAIQRPAAVLNRAMIREGRAGPTSSPGPATCRQQLHFIGLPHVECSRQRTFRRRRPSSSRRCSTGRTVQCRESVSSQTWGTSVSPKVAWEPFFGKRNKKYQWCCFFRIPGASAVKRRTVDASLADLDVCPVAEERVSSIICMLLVFRRQGMWSSLRISVGRIVGLSCGRST